MSEKKLSGKNIHFGSFLLLLLCFIFCSSELFELVLCSLHCESETKTTKRNPFVQSSLRSALLLFALAGLASAQIGNASLGGTVTDQSGASVAGADLTLTNAATGFKAKFTSDDRGEYSFRNLTPGTYDLDARKEGFQSTAQKSIVITINQSARVDVALKVGSQTETISVEAQNTPINFDNGTLQGGADPETVKALPLVVEGKPRSTAALAVLLPGVSTGSSNQAFQARINGGQESGDEALLDGATMQVIILNDRTVEALFPQSPAKAALRTKGRMTTLLLVQGKATKDFQFDPTVKVEQKGKTLEGKASSMKNFTAGKVAKGDQIQGMVELPEKVDLYEPFKVTRWRESSPLPAAHRPRGLRRASGERSRSDRPSRFGLLDDVDRDSFEAADAAFKTWHVVSLLLNMLAIGLAGVVLVLTAALPERRNSPSPARSASEG